MSRYSRDAEDRFDGKLPRGRHRLSREQVVESQRWRLLRAAGDALLEGGYGKASSRRICDRAGVSSSTFYVHFADAEACIVAAHAMAVDCVWELISAACAGTGTWSERLQAALTASTDFLVAEPGLARLLGADVATGIPAVAAARERLLARLAGLLCSGRRLRLETADRLSAGLEVHLTGGAAGLFGDRIVRGEFDKLPALTPELTELLVGSYLSLSAPA